MNIIIGIYGDIYEVSKFVDKHPGEGIHDTYLKYYNRKDATVEFNRFHYTNESDEMLIDSKKIGEGEDFSKIGSFLLSKKNKWITGQILHIDGGRSTLRIKA